MRRGERHKTAGETGHTDNSIEKKTKRRREGVEILVDVGEVKEQDHVCVPSSIGPIAASLC